MTDTKRFVSMRLGVDEAEIIHNLNKTINSDCELICVYPMPISTLDRKNMIIGIFLQDDEKFKTENENKWKMLESKAEFEKKLNFADKIWNWAVKE